MTAKEKKMAGVKKHNEAVKQKKADDVKKAINKLSWNEHGAVETCICFCTWSG